VLRPAISAGIESLEKYYNKTDNSPAHIVSMCPLHRLFHLTKTNILSLCRSQSLYQRRILYNCMDRRGATASPNCCGKYGMCNKSTLWCMRIAVRERSHHCTILGHTSALHAAVAVVRHILPNVHCKSRCYRGPTLGAGRSYSAQEWFWEFDESSYRGSSSARKACH
jgi:hypothetical protein